ncbi:uncharacterized protein LOC123561343 isoform X6 [Mercenaria mercenaria]|uniref:uncharacterized protein LOC123561343 isoform X6 n=1 Tax=Mercenaria mercenaria TaxID=6596 RepID=UPI00234FB4E1|nr:uncharacterized protein LOC123561343 isoform X6 [Mercenaria mercenaria]
MASKFSHLPDISTIQPDRLIKYRVSEDRFSAEVLLPGLSYTDFDQKIGGKMYLWSLAKLCESVRAAGWRNGFAYWTDIGGPPGSGITLFDVKQVFTFSPDAHHVRFNNHFGLNKPQRLCMNVSDVGRTSFSSVIDWFDSGGVKIGSFFAKCVLADAKLRKPLPLPDCFYKSSVVYPENHTLTTSKRSEFPEVPCHAFRFQVKVLRSDYDKNDHVNQATYFRWCSDAAAAGAIKGHFNQIKNYIELYPMKTMEIDHLGEAFINEDIILYVWECEKENNCLMFSIEKEAKAMFRMKMTFYNTNLNTD